MGVLWYVRKCLWGIYWAVCDFTPFCKCCLQCFAPMHVDRHTAHCVQWSLTCSMCWALLRLPAWTSGCSSLTHWLRTVPWWTHVAHTGFKTSFSIPLRNWCTYVAVWYMQNTCLCTILFQDQMLCHWTLMHTGQQYCCPLPVYWCSPAPHAVTWDVRYNWYSCSVLSRLFLGGAAPPYCTNVPPYQCFRGCCTPHKNDGMHAKPICINSNHYQTVIQIVL